MNCCCPLVFQSLQPIQYIRHTGDIMEIGRWVEVGVGMEEELKLIAILLKVRQEELTVKDFKKQFTPYA
jgi:hypothetical protein